MMLMRVKSFKSCDCLKIELAGEPPWTPVVPRLVVVFGEVQY